MKAETCSIKASFPYRCLCDTDRSARKTLGNAFDDGGAKRYQNSAALLIFMRRTTIPNSSFLISHSCKAFIHNQWTEPPKELTLTPNLFFQPESLPERFPAVFLLNTVHGFGGAGALFLFV